MENRAFINLETSVGLGRQRSSEKTIVNGEQKTTIIKAITLVGFTASVFYHYVLSNYNGLGYYPYNTFLFNPADKFNDFYNIYKATIDLNPYAAPVSVYFPFTFIVVYLFTLLHNDHLALYVFTFIFLAFLITYVYRAIPSVKKSEKSMDTFILIFMSYPVLFNLDRGNWESVLFVFLVLFLYYYQKKDDLKSVFFLSLAISMKLYPAVFIVLFLADKKYRNILYTGISVIVITMLSAFMLEGGVAKSLLGLKNNLENFRNAYIMSDHGLQHNASLYGVIKIMKLPLNYYSVLAVVIFALIAAYVILKEDIYWKRVTFLVLSMILLPQVSYDYKLIHLFIPLLLFLNHAKPCKSDLVFALLWGLLLIPKDYYLISGDISIAVLFNPLIMVMMISMILLDRHALKVAQ